MKSEQHRNRLRSLVLLAVLVALVTSGCRIDMHDQARFEPLEESDFFANGSSARMPVEGTIARGFLKEDAAFYEGKREDGTWVEDFPVTVDRAFLERGKERYGIYCTPCHDQAGNGRGMIVERGFKEAASYHDDRLRATPIGYFFDVITNGFGQMNGYAAQIKPQDRWAITAYIRVLQASQNTPSASLAAADLEHVREGYDPAAVEKSSGYGDDDH